MHRIALFYGLAICMTPTATALDPQSLLNADTKAVVAALGSSYSTIKMPNRTHLIYERGTIIISDGKVSQVRWMTDAQYERQRQITQIQREERAEREAIWDKERKQNGERIRDDQRSNPELISAPLGNQIKYWRLFRQRYPTVEIEPQFSELVTLYKEQIESERSDRRIAELKEREAYAQIQVANAEKEAAKARQKAYDSYYKFNTYTPIPSSMPAYKPPTYYFSTQHSSTHHSTDHDTHNEHHAPLSSSPASLIHSITPGIYHSGKALFNPGGSYTNSHHIHYDHH